jgi:hypothetical protein
MKRSSKTVKMGYTLLGLDFPVRVIRPVELRDLLRQLAQRALQVAGDEQTTSNHRKG